MEFLSYLISGISLGSIYAIIALGYTMVYGIAKMLNFAHGDIIMVGAYICFFTMSRMSSSLLVGAVAGTLLAMAVCTVLGVVIERLAYLGITLDEEANSKRGDITEISTKDSKVRVFVIPTDEEYMIAKDTMNIVFGA